MTPAHRIKDFLTRAEFCQCTVDIHENTPWAGWHISRRDEDCKEATRYLSLLHRGELNGKSFQRTGFHLYITFHNKVFNLHRKVSAENMTVEKAHHFMLKHFPPPPQTPK